MKTREIADFLGAEMCGDGDVEINGVASMDSASAGELAFIESNDANDLSKASCLLVPSDFVKTLGIPLIRVSNPKLAFALWPQYSIRQRTGQVKFITPL